MFTKNTNAGIRPPYHPTSNRHAVSSSDPPPNINININSNNIHNYDSHQPRLSDSYVFPSTPMSSTSTSTAITTATATTIMTTSSAIPRSARTTVYAPPSCFHSSYLPQSSTNSSRNYHSHAPSSSSLSIIAGPGTLSSSLTSLFTKDNNPSQSSIPPLRRNANSGTAAAAVAAAGAPGAAGAINVKRLMSKPTAILPLPLRAHSVLSFPVQSSDTEDSTCDHHAIKSRSLEILTRSKRRSRSVDILQATHKHAPNDYHDVDDDEEDGLIRFNTLATRPSQRHPTLHPQGQPDPPLNMSLQRTGTGTSSYQHVHSPSTPTFLGSIRDHRDDDKHKIDDNSHCRRRRTKSGSTSAEVPQHGSSSPSPPPSSLAGTPCSSFATPIVSPVTPASAIALAWTESQKQASSGAAVIACDAATSISRSTSFPPVHSSSSRSTSLPISSVPTRTTGHSITSIVDSRVSSHRNGRTAPGPLTTTTTAKKKTGLDMTTAVGAGTTIDDPSVSWVVAERILSPIERDDSVVQTSMGRGNTLPRPGARSIMGTKAANGNGMGVGAMSATVRGLSRRLTGAFGRKGKSLDEPNFQPQIQTAEIRVIHNMEGLMASTSNTNTNVNSKQNSNSIFDSVVSALESRTVPEVPTIHTSPNTSNQSNPTMFHELPSSISSHLHPHPVDPFVGAIQAELISPSGTSTFSDTTTVVDNQKNDMPLWSLSSSNSKRNVRQEMFSQHGLFPPVLSPTPRDTRLERPTNTATATPRSTTPNTLKKRSRGHLRKKLSSSSLSSLSSVFVPVGSDSNISEKRMQEQARDAHTIMSMSGMTPALTPTASILDSSEEYPFSAAGKLRGLVRKLSSGALRRCSPQSDKIRTLGRTSTSSGSAGSLNGHWEKAFVPPVPPLPKDFELIVDPEAYLAERSRRREERVDSEDDNESAAHSSRLTPQRMFGSSLKASRVSSRRSSPIPPSLHGQAEPIPPTSRLHTYSESPLSKSSLPLPTSPPHRVGTEPIPVDITAHSIPPSRYVFPERPRPKQDLSSSVGSTSYSISGTDHVMTEYRTSSPTPSSPDLSSNRNLGANHDDIASLSSHDMGSSSLSHSMIAHPIMAPKELYRHWEDEAATLRIRQQAKEKADVAFRKKRSNQGPTTSEPVRAVEKALMSQPLKASPTLMVPLGMPPPRPSRRETKSKVSTASSTDIKFERLRPVHAGRKRSISSPPPRSPVFPGVPVFSNTDAVNSIAISERSRSLGGRHHSPHVPVDPLSPTIRPRSQTRTRSKSQTSLKSRDAKNLPPLQVSTNSPVVVSSAQSSPSLHDADDTDSHSRRKLRLKTSMGALDRFKSLIGSARSSSHTPGSHTPTSNASHSGVSPQSGGFGRGGRFTLGRTSREDGEMPHMPFTSTAFTFKENSPMSPPKGIKLTEGEREDLWNALLERSERAGGTLTVALDQLEGPSLQSDDAKFISTQDRDVKMWSERK